MVVKTPTNFTLTAEQIKKIEEWLGEHAKTCPHLSQRTFDWFGSPIHYRFTPHGIGINIECECNCGAKVDVTESEDW